MKDMIKITITELIRYYVPSMGNSVACMDISVEKFLESQGYKQDDILVAKIYRQPIHEYQYVLELTSYAYAPTGAEYGVLNVDRQQIGRVWFCPTLKRAFESIEYPR